MGNPRVFSGQKGCLSVVWVCPLASYWLGTPREPLWVLRWHPCYMHELPQLAPFHTKEQQFYYELSPNA